ncbi:MAG: UDP-N-acetylmuramoyl-tripeptide--D-alanyl-D-alanine ligase [Arcobacteraceae bacterium]|jgi:UDP-N-acetylmuramoyl-tripeptide--D-alanyl-D-alanine ligase|nr:UDP-N-acetylmuramoyl-tripeptide--D-alanyl-D-alanine ligase [Arcobacteraceae bacterium]MDY0365458.1 UDP-N-acetylmuramoyl-tripeptide--D-alanyl-D-alanine ligase [Arcobacteraceae bacterium]
MSWINLFEVFTYFLLILSLGWYLITNLQWYNYQIQRVVLKHHKPHWHMVYFITPYVLFYLLPFEYFAIYFYILYIGSVVLWHKKLDRSLVLTKRVIRFFAILFVVSASLVVLCLALDGCSHLGLVLPLIITYFASSAVEKVIFLSFKEKAKQRLKSFETLKVVAITASFGKTSIKNYLFQVISKKYNTYMTPRSVNTIAGILKDVNSDLPQDTQIYIAEAGARAKGDIEEITKFLEPQIAVIGSVGEQHIEYFKTLDNIIYTKMEILSSPRLEYGFVHESVPILKYPKIKKFPDSLKIIKNNLEGIWFDLEVDGKVEHFYAPILGSFNAINLTAVILVAHQLGMSIDEIKFALSELKPVAHRLELIKAGGKLILDDSFNGNLEGMLEGINLASMYNGRKVIVTPGIVESTEVANITLAKAINRVFDLVIITGDLNKKIFEKELKNKDLIFLKNKKELENVLAQETKLGDLILFANDAPNFI